MRVAQSEDRPISLAILAIGGQGGGTLAGWIVDVAEANSWFAQSTSVPGVAQRTGATLYYIEMIATKDGKRPVFSLMPSPGDVDIVLAAEWMEAGRAILRGLVTPDRTCLIASTHRSLAISEKQQPGNGIADSSVIARSAEDAANRVVAFDMQQIADQEGTAISAPLLGALAGSRRLPFPVQSFSDAVARSERGSASSLRAFSRACETAQQFVLGSLAAGEAQVADAAKPVFHRGLIELEERIRGEFPESAHAILSHGVLQLTDYQDLAYAHEYLDRLKPLLQLDGEESNYELTMAAARHLAAAMIYDDIMRVADLKTRRERIARINRQMPVASGQILYASEVMHPRTQEVIGCLPVRLGSWIESRPGFCALLDRWINRGRRIESLKLRGFVPLYLLAGLRRWRRGTLRHQRESRRIDFWLSKVQDLASVNYPLALEVIKAQRLIKGYAETHARGLSKFERVISALPSLQGRKDGGDWMRRLVAAALLDEDGMALNETLRTIESFTNR